MKEVKFFCSCGSELHLASGFYYCKVCNLKFPEKDLSCPCCNSPLLPYRCDIPVAPETLEYCKGLVCSNPDCSLYAVHKSAKTITLRYDDKIIFKEHSWDYPRRKFALAHYEFKTGSIWRVHDIRTNIMRYLKKVINIKLGQPY